jgi:Raf kinase inhibitor-like YbhB/YbcL family protein
MQLSSPHWQHQSLIPARFTCLGENISPALTWSDVPVQTQSFVLRVHDPDAPAKDWLHWLVINIPPTTLSVAANQVPAGGTAILNDGNVTHYDGPCPPSGTHRYFFNIFALDIPQLTATTRTAVETVMADHILAVAEFMGTVSAPHS